MSQLARRYFGTDGIRGLVGELPITPEFVLKLGFAAGCVFTQMAQNTPASKPVVKPTVLIGKDTRISGYMLESALEAGLSAAGVDVLLVGPMPTPGVAYLTRALRLCAGIVISASHNPYHDNGIKFFSADGNKLPDAIEAAIEAKLQLPLTCVSSDKLGKAKRLDDAAGRYIEFCKNTFPPTLDLHGLKIVIDCAHGAAYHIAPHVLHELGAEVIAIGNVPTGVNINQEVGATHPDALVEAVLTHQADVGIALDGDADRVVMADAKGRLYNGDYLLYVLAKDRFLQRAWSSGKGGVAGTLMTNMAFELAMQTMNIPFCRAQVGDRYVLEQLQQRGWNLGGETSGHILCLDKHSTGDGMIAALQVLSAVIRHQQTLAEFTADLILFPQTLINIRVPNQFDWQNHQPLLKEKFLVEQELGAAGRVLIRASGTEPVLRVMVEAKQAQVARAAAEQLADSVEKMG